MIKFENVEVVGWEHAIRGMRNPKNSWDKSDSNFCHGDVRHCDGCPHFAMDENERGGWCEVDQEAFVIGKNDLDLMTRLRNAGTEHRKFMRMIVVYVDITAPLYWWKEFDTYKVGTVANSCSTMHKIHDKEFTLDDFSHEHLNEAGIECLEEIIDLLNANRMFFRTTKEKDYWWQMIQILPTSYNQKRTVMLNYEVLANIYKPGSRKYHKQDEWNVDCEGSFCQWIESLPYSELITGK